MKTSSILSTGLAFLGAGSAHAALVVTTFNYTGAREDFVVPAGVNQISVEMYGARGGEGGSFTEGGGPGGHGHYLAATLNVTVGSVLRVSVGEVGSSRGVVGGLGGSFGGGGIEGLEAFAGSSQYGGGGGGMSGISAGLNWQMVAGGGGGGGGGGNGLSPFGGIGGDYLTGTGDGGAGETGGAFGGLSGGNGGTGGSGASGIEFSHGTDGSAAIDAGFGQGGRGGRGLGAQGRTRGGSGGGGGGGGYFGGGGGGGGNPNDTNGEVGGGGGGAGSSFADSVNASDVVLVGASDAQYAASNGHGLVVIRYESIPEPSGALLLCLGGVFGLTSRRRAAKDA